jgi:glycosyltransferase involved in cell wall biosynthesis
MIILLLATLSVIVLYLLYPLWLLAGRRSVETSAEQITFNGGISLIYLSHNGQHHLIAKIERLLRELSVFEHYELIIVDDGSTDGSAELIRSFSHPRLRTILKNSRQGIAHSMNTAVEAASCDVLIFCDQRQRISRGALSKLINPFVNPAIGAVSACISWRDKNGNASWMRKYENILKCLESKSGNLIGVYGPLYAVRKDCYCPLPDHIILDDMYVSLKILPHKKVILRTDCLIVEDDMAVLYNYQRTRRYLKGLMQLQLSRDLFRRLSLRQLLMLLWHKYLKLLIPLLLCACLLVSCILGSPRLPYLLLSALILFTGLLSVFSDTIKTRFPLSFCIGIHFLYLAASVELLGVSLYKGIFRRQGAQAVSQEK